MNLHSIEKFGDLGFDVVSHFFAFDKIDMGNEDTRKIMDKGICSCSLFGLLGRSLFFPGQKGVQQWSKVLRWFDIFSVWNQQTVVVRRRISQQSNSI